MDWKLLALCFVSIATATVSNGGWKPGTSYTYTIQGLTFSGHEVGNQYSGIYSKGLLTINVQPDRVLLGKIHGFQYARIHTNLPDGPLSHIPQSQLKYEDVPMSGAFFKILLKNGVVKEIQVRKHTPQWEVNIIKSIISQIQLDTMGENLIKSRYNLLPEENASSGSYKTMEETVTGNFETLYELNELEPVHYQEKPWLVPHPNLKGTGKIIEIAKNRNFTRGEGHIGYHYGFNSAEEWKAFGNKVGQFVSRSGVSHHVISGTLSRYTIQSVVSTNVIAVTPANNKDHTMMVTSRYNLTLATVNSDVEPHEEQHADFTTLRSLTFSYSRPNSQKYADDMKQHSDESSEEDNVSSSSEDPSSNEKLDRHPLTDALDWYPLTQVPPSKLGPFEVDENMDQNLKKQNIAELVKQLSRQIAEELSNPEAIQKKDTLSKFMVMVALVRTFDEKELEEITYQLVPEQITEYDAQWEVYLDALAESGSGPSLLVLKKLIKDLRIKGESAAQLLAQASRAVRQPTFEYMRTFYELTKEDQVESQLSLNETAILAFADLVGKVYGDEHVSDNAYPTNAYGRFYTQRGKKFVVEEYIPHLRRQLDTAVEEKDSRKAQVYIYALGYVADPTILIAFEKYLEGKKEVSHFLRTQMVVALGRMSKVYPNVAQPVLYRIYRNSGEHQDVRVVAAQYLTNTELSADMFQQMAAFTNIDSNEYVNAAVAKIIRSIADLKTHQHRDIQANAQSAVHLLNRKYYPLFLSTNFYNDGICSPIFSFTELFRTIGSEDSFFNKAMSYTLRTNAAGIDRKAFSVQYMISNLEALAQALSQEHFQHVPAGSSKWTGESIRRDLKIESDQIEEAEANIRVEMAGIKRLFTFHPQMVQHLEEVVREVEQRLGKGQDFHYTKLIQLNEMTMSLPTETGLPFYFAVHNPLLIDIEGRVSGEAQPKLVQDGKLRAPQQIKLAADVKIVIAAKMQKSVGFVTPCHLHYYSAVYDKDIQTHLPLKVQVIADMEENKYELQFQTDKSHKRIQVLRYSTTPYTSRQDMTDLSSFKENRHEVNAKPNVEIDHVFGQKSTGMAWRVHLSTDKRHLNLDWLKDLKYDIQNSEIKIEHDTELSENDKIKVQLGYHSHRDWTKAQESEQSQDALKELYELPEDHEDRHNQLYKQSRYGIQNAQIYMVEANVTFQGEREIKYSAVATSSSSPVDEDSRILVHANRRDAVQKENDYQAAIVIDSRMAKTNQIDPFYSLKHNPKSQVSVRLAFGYPYATATKVIAKVDLDRSEKRTRHLEKSSLTQQCSNEASKKNLQLPACLEVIYESHLFDQIRVQMRSENVSPQLQNLTQHLGEHIAYLFYKNRETNTVNATGSGGDHQVINVDFDEDLEEVSIAIHSMDKEVQYNDIKIPAWIQPIVTVAPDVSAVERWLRWAAGTDAIKPSCSVDQSAVNTFDGKTYAMELKNDWTVMFVYAPNQVKQHYKQGSPMKQFEEYVVLTRGKTLNKKEREVKITLRSAETKHQHVEIDLTTKHDKLKASVNGRDIPVSSEELISINEGAIEMHLLPNNELKVKINHVFDMVYDGKRVRLDMPHASKFQNKIRGLCGTADGHEYTDFKAPRGCIYNNLKQFVEAYQPYKRQSGNKDSKLSCNFRKVIFADVIGDQDVRRYEGDRHSSRHCSHFQTQYTKIGNEICFSEKLQPVCQPGCKSKHYNEKPVSALCWPRGDHAIELMRKVDDGENLDFESQNKDDMKKVIMKVAQDCTRI